MKYKKVEKLILKLSWSHATTQDEVEELVCVGNLAFVKGMEKFNGNETTFSTYMYRIINNAMIDYKRKQRNQIKYTGSYIEDMKVEPKDKKLNGFDFLESLSDLSYMTRYMVYDLLSDPIQLFRKTKYGGRKYLKSAFKKLMLDYGYEKEDIQSSVLELTDFMR